MPECEGAHVHDACTMPKVKGLGPQRLLNMFTGDSSSRHCDPYDAWLLALPGPRDPFVWGAAEHMRRRLRHCGLSSRSLCADPYRWTSSGVFGNGVVSCVVGSPPDSASIYSEFRGRR